MLTSTSVAQDLSICLRCQYRIALRHRPRSGRRNRLLNTPSTRHMTSVRRSLQKESQSETFAQAQEDDFPLAQESNGAKLHRTQWKHWKHDDIYSTGTLGMDALGGPTEIIMLPQGQGRDSFFRADKAEDATENHHVNISPTGILENIQGECALINIERVSIYIEKLRTSWLSQLQDRHSIPTRAEYIQMVNSLQEGFTLPQLLGYFEAGIAKLPESVFDLARPYSTDLYTRSSWLPGCSPFPGRAADQLHHLKHRRSENIKKNGDDKRGIPEGFETLRKSFRSKTSIAATIVRVLWNVKVLEEVGELDMLVEPIQFGILLSHRKSVFNRLTETYGVKVDISRSRKIIRITSDRDACCDVFKSILQTLENIHGVNVSLPLDPHKKNSYLEELTFLNLIQQIEHLTGTIIRRVPPPTSKRKGGQRQYRIFYLGPDEDGLESAKRKLTQTLPSTASKLPFVVWNDQEFLQGRPRPTEIGSALPLVARGIQWSRWASPIKRNSEAPLVSEGLDVSHDWSQSLSRSIFNMLFKYAKLFPLNRPKTYTGLFWGESPKPETFANFGQVVYPSKKLNTLHQALEAKRINIRSRALHTSLASQRHLVCGFPGLRFVLQNANPDMQVGEDLRIRLKPSPEVLVKERDGRFFPDVELRINCDLATKTCKFSSARLILDRQETDLLLPTETVDIRFCSMTHIPSGAKTDPQILNFLSSSNVDVFAQQALSISDTLVLSIPAHSVRKPPSEGRAAHGAHKPENIEDSFLEGGPDITVKYVLSDFEHWSHMSGDIMGLNFEYATITGGEMRREEIRMMLYREEESQLDLAAFEARFNVLLGMIKRLRDVDHARGIDRKIAASLDPNTRLAS